MNERIKEIDTMAQEYAGRIAGNDEESNYVEWFNIYKEKFAELIVKECAKIAEIQWMDISDEENSRSSAKRIKEHFDFK